MSEWQLTALGLQEGVWYGVLAGGAGVPQIDVVHLDTPVAEVSVEEAPDGWRLRVPVPTEAVSDGVQTFLITDRVTGTVLGNFALMAGEGLGHDLRAEVDLLRAELDMLKRAFRRHCVETS